MKYLKQVVLLTLSVSLNAHANDFGLSNSLIGHYSTNQKWEVNFPNQGTGFKIPTIGQERCPITGEPRISLPVEQLGSLSLGSCFPTETISLSEELSLDFLKTTFSFSTLSLSDNISAFQKQRDICSCVNGRTAFSAGLSKRPLSADDILKSESYALAHLENMINSFSERSHYTHNMMILHAQSMGEDTSISYGLNQPVNINEGYRKLVNDAIHKNIKDNVELESKNKEEFDQKVNEIMKKSHEEKKGDGVLSLLSGREVQGESCLPMKHYLLIKSFPEQNEFWSVFDKNFSKDDWNQSRLKSILLTTKDERERSIVESKLEFLEKNPFIKLALNSSDTAAANRVYNTMKKNMGGLPKNCASSSKGCHEQFVVEKLSKYHEEMTSIFKEPEMMELIKKERNLDVEKHIGELLSNSQNKLNIESLNTWAAARNIGSDLNYCAIMLSGRDIVEKASFTNLFSYGVNNAYTSSMLSENVSQDYLCEKMVTNYCIEAGSGTDSILARGSNIAVMEGNAERLDELYKRVYYEMDSNPENNLGYNSFSKEMCENNFRMYRNQSVNFLSFQKSFCTDRSNESLCSNKEKLLYEFHKLREDEGRNDTYTNNSYVGKYFKNSVQFNDISERDRVSFARNAGGAASSLFEVNTGSEISKNNTLNLDKRFVESSLGAASTDSSQLDQSMINNSSSAHQRLSNNYDLSNVQNSMRESKEEIDEEIRSTKAAIAYNKERLARPNTTPEFRSDIEGRLQMLENLLAEKEKSSQQYQEIISKLIDSQKKEQSGAATSSRLASSSEENNENEAGEDSGKIVAASNVRSVVPTHAKNNDNLEDFARGPASVAENFSTSGGVQGGAAFMGAASTQRSSSASVGNRGTINSALLSKYGITVQESDANVQVALDRESGQISQLLTNASKSDIGLEVSKVEYDKFKNNDLNALNQLYEDRIEMLESDVVKLMIHAEGVEESLEFYAIKEDGKVVFQPVRKSRLSDLQNALK